MAGWSYVAKARKHTFILLGLTDLCALKVFGAELVVL